MLIKIDELASCASGRERQHTLALHGTNSAVLQEERDERTKDSRKDTYGKEDPLEHDAFIVTSGGEGQETLGVVLAHEIEKNGGALKDGERLWLVLAVNKDGDTTVGVHSDEPRLLLTVSRDVNLLDPDPVRSGAACCKTAALTRNRRRCHRQL